MQKIVIDSQHRSTFDFVMKISMIAFFLLTFAFSFSQETREMRNLFIALSWVVFVTRETDYLFRKNKVLRCFVGFILAAPLAPLGVTFIVSGMEAVKGYISGIGIEDTWKTVGKCFSGMARIGSAVKQGSIAGLQQGDSFYVILGGFALIFLVCFACYAIANACREEPKTYIER
jgi:hypothetical protein